MVGVKDLKMEVEGLGLGLLSSTIVVFGVCVLQARLQKIALPN